MTANEAFESELVAVINQLGFVVVTHFKPMRIGEQFSRVCTSKDRGPGTRILPQRFSVIGEATVEDFNRQQQIVERLRGCKIDQKPEEYLYRAITD